MLVSFMSYESVKFRKNRSKVSSFKVTARNCYMRNVGYRMWDIDMTALRRDSTYKMIYHGWLFTIVNFLIPFLLLIVMNSAVIAAIFGLKVKQATLYVHDNCEEVAKKRRLIGKEISTSIMLVGVVIIFLIGNSVVREQKFWFWELGWNFLLNV